MLFQGLVSIWGFSSRLVTPFVASQPLKYLTFVSDLTNDSVLGTFLGNVFLSITSVEDAGDVASR